MTHCAVTDNGLAFDYFSDKRDLVVSEQHANAFADCSGVAADCDELSVAVRAHRDIARKTQYAISVWFK